MDVVAVLTKEIQEQLRTIEDMQTRRRRPRHSAPARAGGRWVARQQRQRAEPVTTSSGRLADSLGASEVLFDTEPFVMPEAEHPVLAKHEGDRQTGDVQLSGGEMGGVP
jgi:hypothetical protein